MKHNLFLGIVNAPYRVDLCNFLYEEYDCDCYFLHRRLEDACFSETYCEHISRYKSKYLQTRVIAGRKVARLSCLWRLLKSHRPDCVFVPELSLTALAVLFLRWIVHGHYKVVSICDDNMDMLTGKDLSRFHTLSRRLIIKRLDNLVLTNPQTVAWYQSRFGKGVFFPIMPDEVRLRGEMEQAIPCSEAWLDRYGLRGKKIILYVGRLIPVKNLERLLDAMGQVDGRAVLVLVGEGVERPGLEALAGDSPCVLFVGRQSGPDLLAWYNLADVLVLPSIQEAFGAVVSEALTGGCPAAVSERAGSAFLVESGRNGFIFHPDSVSGIADAIKGALNIPAAEGPVRLRDSLMPLSFRSSVERMLSQL